MQSHVGSLPGMCCCQILDASRDVMLTVYLSGVETLHAVLHAARTFLQKPKACLYPMVKGWLLRSPSIGTKQWQQGLSRVWWDVGH